jgi:hypothetical protein
MILTILRFGFYQRKPTLKRYSLTISEKGKADIPLYIFRAGYKGGLPVLAEVEFL